MDYTGSAAACFIIHICFVCLSVSSLACHHSAYLSPVHLALPVFLSFTSRVSYYLSVDYHLPCILVCLC